MVARWSEGPQVRSRRPEMLRKPSPPRRRLRSEPPVSVTGSCVQRAGDGVGPAGGAADAGAGGATGDDIPVEGCEPADAAVGRGGTGPCAAPGCGGIGAGAVPGSICGVGTGPAP